MTIPEESQSRLLAYLAEKGVKVRFFESVLSIREEFDYDNSGYEPAPFKRGLGVRWAEKEIVAIEGMDWPSLVHEAGHILASKEPPQRSDEYAFLGWEFALCQHLGLPLREWYEQNRDYSLDYWIEGTIYYSYVSELLFGSAEWDGLIEDRIKESSDLGLIPQEWA